MTPQMWASFSNELQKEAKKKEPEKPALWKRTGAGLLGYYGGALATAPISLGGTAAALGAARPSMGVGVTSQEIGRMKGSMGLPADLPVNHVQDVLQSHYKPAPGPVLQWLGSVVPPEAQAPEFRKAVGPEYVQANQMHGAVVAHELGHAANARTLGLKQLQAMRPLGGMASSAGVLGGLMASADNEQADKYAPIVASGSHIPTLIDEGAASLRGLKALHGIGLTRKELARSAGQLGLAYGSYLGAAAAPGVMVHVGRKIKKRLVGAKQPEPASMDEK